MAKPIQDIHRIKTTPEQERQNDVEEILTVLTEHKESVLALLEIVQKLQDRGILDLLNGLLGQGDKVAEIAAREMNKPGVSNSIDHLMNLAAIVGEIDIHKIKGLSEQVNHGIEKAEASMETDEKVSMFDLVRAVKDPEINRVLKASLHFMKGAGHRE